MAEFNIDGLLETVKEYNPFLRGVIMDPTDLIFEENVKMNCFYCGKYNNNWRCPPRLPNIDYEKLMMEYGKGMFVVYEHELNEEVTLDSIRSESTNILHKGLLSFEKYMWNNGFSNTISFIGGSCKLCKGGCGKERCNNPYMSRSSIESTGVNVVKSTKKYGINIEFPPVTKLHRVGLLLWQEE